MYFFKEVRNSHFWRFLLYKFNSIYVNSMKIEISNFFKKVQNNNLSISKCSLSNKFKVAEFKFLRKGLDWKL